MTPICLAPMAKSRKQIQNRAAKRFTRGAAGANASYRPFTLAPSSKPDGDNAIVKPLQNPKRFLLHRRAKDGPRLQIVMANPKRALVRQWYVPYRTELPTTNTY